MIRNNTLFSRIVDTDESGFAMVLLAGCMTLLVVVAALAIDLGTWYLRANEIQRAADAAALAGASKMPDIAAANDAAKTMVERNGFAAGGDISVTYEPYGTDRFNVRIHDAKVGTFFAQLFKSNISIGRWSYAEFTDAVPMGSPFNALGMGDISLGAIPQQNYWLAVNGYCLPKEDGDLFLAGYDGTVQRKADGSYKGVSCDTSLPGSEVNLDHNSHGYDYIVDVPSAAGPVTISIYDPAYSSNPASRSSSGIRPGGGKSPDAGKASNAKVTTTFTLWDTRGTAVLSDDTVVKRATFGTNDPAGIDKMYALATVAAPTGGSYKYRLQVATLEGEANSLGVNAFGLTAKAASGSNCDSRVSTACPAIYGRNAISLFANLNPGSTGYVDLYLAQIAGTYAGKPLQVALWDPGEQARSIQLINPNGAAQTFSYNAQPAPSKGASGSTNNLDVSGTNVASPGLNRSNTYQYNDRLVVMTVPLPTSYLTSSGDGWWKLRYRINSSLTERATWSAAVENGDPVHLLRQRG